MPTTIDALAALKMRVCGSTDCRIGVMKVSAK